LATSRPDDVVFRPNAILDKASCVEDVQPNGHQSPLSGRSDLIMEIACVSILASFWTKSLVCVKML